MKATAGAVVEGLRRNSDLGVDLAMCRREAYWVLRKQYGFSLPYIGKIMSRDHTSVLHGIRKLEYLIDKDAAPEPNIRILLEQSKRHAQDVRSQRNAEALA